MANDLTQYFLEYTGLQKYDALIKKHIPIYGTKAYYESAEVKDTLVPQDGQIVVYTDFRVVQSTDGNITTAGIKIGDGTTAVGSLKFIDWFYWDHINNSEIHVTADEKTFWNNKVTCELGVGTENETLFFKKD